MDTRYAKGKSPVDESANNTPIDKRTPLEKHVEYFGGGHEISYTSNMRQNERLGDDWFTANKTAFIFQAGGLPKMSKCPFSTFKPKDTIGVLNHSYHTGIYNQDGTFNEEAWKKIYPYTDEDQNGKLIITEKQFYAFLENCRQKDYEQYPYNILDLGVSTAEWSAYWGKFSEVNPSGVKYVTVDNLRQFFLDSRVVGEELEDKVRYGM